MDVGRRLRAIREERGLSQRELATKAGLTNGTISLIEKNKTSPSVASLKSLLDAIPISMAEFFSTLEDTQTPKVFYRETEFTEISPPPRVRFLCVNLGTPHSIRFRFCTKRILPVLIPGRN